ncbi:MAG: FimV-like protein [Marinoscillum sp.]
MKKAALAIFIFYSLTSTAQLFDKPNNMLLVKKGVESIYNIEMDTADIYIKKVEAILPGHPAVPMMRALKILWKYIPIVTADTIFRDFTYELREVIRLSAAMDGGRQSHPEAIFFEMSARGLLAEYYADEGQYMKALSEAGKAYDLVKKGFELSESIPEFLLTSGVYNYFREKYPEKYPIYKPFLWFFKSGNTKLGLEQIHEATEKAVLTNVEAYIYMGYIYLRYEYQPKKAQQYLWEINRKYPNNIYIQTKLLESLANPKDFAKAPINMITELIAESRPYYKMAGHMYYGYYLEKVKNQPNDAFAYYSKTLMLGGLIEGHAEYSRDMARLGLARIYIARDEKSLAREHLENVLSDSDSEALKEEAEALLDKI